MIGIGIDTGGTYTDCVVFDTSSQEVLGSCKRLTTKRDLSRGILNCLDALPKELLGKAQWVALSTTLATNACVEDKGGRAKLCLIGTDDATLRRIDAPKRYGLQFDSVLTRLSCGTFDGQVVDEPDWEEWYAANEAFFKDADAVAVAELHAPRNGAVVERNGAAFFSGKLAVPTVQATSVASDINVMERAATALLNARLLPVIKEFMEAVYTALDKRGIDLPVLIMRSDGTLMSGDFARQRPVETVLSGPAASVSGACALADTSLGLLVDMGGTTTDVSVVRSNRPVMSGGINIGGWRTQVKGVFIDTIGLGGDSSVKISASSHVLALDSRKATPLCIAASQWPHITETLKRLVDERLYVRRELFEFLYMVNEPKDMSRYTDSERKLMELLEGGPLSIADSRYDPYELRSERLETEGVVMRCGLTPTDAMHIKGDFAEYDSDASRYAALYLARLDPELGEMMSCGEEERCAQVIADRIYELTQRKLYNQISRILFEQRHPDLCKDGLGPQLKRVIDEQWEEFIDRERNTVRKPKPGRELLEHVLSTDATLVGIGAPTHLFLPAVAKALGTTCVIPEYAGVANAIGAVLAQIDAHSTTKVVPVRGSEGVVTGYLVRSLENSRRFEEFEVAQAMAKAEALRLAEKEARERGAVGELELTLEDDSSKLTGADGVTVTLEWSYTAWARSAQGIEGIACEAGTRREQL